MDARWTLAELVARAAHALAAADVRAPNGRVTEVPDARMIRWYTTTGLLDRPAMRGRTARYGTRHLLQLVAVKRLQAQGLPLAQIQARLAGATDEVLGQVAALPAATRVHPGTGDTGRSPTPSPSPRSAERFWSEHPVTQNPATLDTAGDTVTRVYGVNLHGLTLLLAAEPEARDLPDIEAAARPLLDLLAARGWLGGAGGQVRLLGLLNPTEGANS